LIWFGAIERGGTVGLHRPKINDPQFGALPSDQASTQYRKVLQEIARYLEEMEVPKSLIEVVVATGSSDIRWIEARPNSVGMLHRSPSHTEWLDANCDPLTAEDYAALGKLSERQVQHMLAGRTYRFTRVDEALQEKERRRVSCASILEYSQRDRMLPP
jgi:hypothetical protein